MARVDFSGMVVKRITGKQVNLLLAKGGNRGLRGIKLLEFIEYECGVQVMKLEDIRESQLQGILDKLED